jgi:hypothetical protein
VKLLRPEGWHAKLGIVGHSGPEIVTLVDPLTPGQFQGKWIVSCRVGGVPDHGPAEIIVGGSVGGSETISPARVRQTFGGLGGASFRSKTGFMVARMRASEARARSFGLRCRVRPDQGAWTTTGISSSLLHTSAVLQP